MKETGIGIIGLGVVGQGVFKHLHRNAPLLSERTGSRLSVKKVFARNRKKKRDVTIAPALWAANWQSVVDDPAVQIVVELVGGTTVARQIVSTALKKGKTVVTANKALLAEHGNELFALSAKYKAPLFYEASVAGGIPIIKALNEGLVANRVLSLHGIVNGTCNYILSSMTQSGAGFETALAEAQKLGFAEADPTLDIDGWDAAHKTCILASLAYGFWVNPKQMYVEGIRRISAQDICYARQLGYVIKLLGIIRADGKNDVEIRVHPALVPKEHVLAQVNGSFNAICVRGDVVGDTLFYGRGAGQDPTASAVIGDIAEAAGYLTTNKQVRSFCAHKLYGKVKKIDDTVNRYYLRLSVLDKPGVLAQIARILSKHKIGISSVIQPESDEEGEHVPLVLLIHDSLERNLRAALKQIDKLSTVKAPTRLIRIETFE